MMTYHTHFAYNVDPTITFKENVDISHTFCLYVVQKHTDTNHVISQ